MVRKLVLSRLIGWTETTKSAAFRTTIASRPQAYGFDARRPLRLVPRQDSSESFGPTRSKEGSAAVETVKAYEVSSHLPDRQLSHPTASAPE